MVLPQEFANPKSVITTLCVNLSGLRDGQITGKTLFLGVSVRVSPKEISIGISRLSMDDGSHQSGWTSYSLLRAQ